LINIASTWVGASATESDGIAQLFAALMRFSTQERRESQSTEPRESTMLTSYISRDPRQHGPQQCHELPHHASSCLEDFFVRKDLI